MRALSIIGAVLSILVWATIPISAIAGAVYCFVNNVRGGGWLIFVAILAVVTCTPTVRFKWDNNTEDKT